MPFAAVALEAVGFVHGRGRQVRAIVISQLAALRDAAAAKNAIGGLGDEVEVLGRLQVVMATLMRAHPTLYLFHLVAHPVEINDQVAHNGQIVQRLKGKLVGAERVQQRIELGLAGKECAAVDLQRTAAADGVATCAGEAERRILLLANLGEAPEQGVLGVGQLVTLAERALAVEAAHIEDDGSFGGHQYVLFSGGNFVTETGR